jgi:hypothetical protein
MGARLYYEEGNTEVYSSVFKKNGRTFEGFFWRFETGKFAHGPYHTAEEAEQAANDAQDATFRAEEWAEKKLGA